MRLRPRAVRMRAVLVAVGLALVLAAAGTAVLPAPSTPPRLTPRALAERLGPETWALAIPATWLSAPLPGLREGDVVDLLGIRITERATATEVAAGLRVMSADERTVVVELTAEDAASIAEARARGLTLIPILRSMR